MIPFGHLLLFTGLLFLLGVLCAVTRRNLIMILLGVEVMLNAASITFVGAALRWHNMEGQIIVLFLLAIAAAEVSIGLALIVYLYRQKASVDPGMFNELQ